MKTDDWGPMIWTWLHAATLPRLNTDYDIRNSPYTSTRSYNLDSETTSQSGHVTPMSFEQDKAIGQIIVLFQWTLPCQLCRKNLITEITQINDSNGHVADFERRVLRGEVFSRRRLECMLHCLHNSVNKRLNKPQFPREMLQATYSSIPVDVLDIKLMQFLNAVVYVCSVDGLRRDNHVVMLLYAFMSAFPFEWRIDSLLYQALVSTLSLTSRESRSQMAAQVWYSILSALAYVVTNTKAPSSGRTPVRQTAADLMGAWNDIVRVQLSAYERLK